MDGVSNGRSLSPLRLPDPRPRSQTVLVAGFSGALGAGIREVIARDAALTVVGAGAEDDVTTLVATHRPDVALVNHDAVSSLAGVRELVLQHRLTRVVMAVMRLNQERDARLLDAGVSVVVPLTIDVAELCGVLRLVAGGLVGPGRQHRVAESAGMAELTRRELQVMSLLLVRRSAREIALELHVTEATVNSHRRHIYEKLGVHSRAELAEHAPRIFGEGPLEDNSPPAPSRDRAAFRRRRREAELHGSGFSVALRLPMRWALGH